MQSIPIRSETEMGSSIYRFKRSDDVSDAALRQRHSVALVGCKALISLDWGFEEGHSPRRWIGKQIRQPSIDARILAPDRRIKAGGQSGLKLCGAQPHDSRIVRDVTGALA